MAKCKFCGQGVRTAPVFHPACWEQRANKVMEEFCDEYRAVFTGVRSEFLQLIRIIRTTAVTISCTATRTRPSWRSIFRRRPLR